MKSLKEIKQKIKEYEDQFEYERSLSLKHQKKGDSHGYRFYQEGLSQIKAMSNILKWACEEDIVNNHRKQNKIAQIFPDIFWDMFEEDQNLYIEFLIGMILRSKSKMVKMAEKYKFSEEDILELRKKGLINIE